MSQISMPVRILLAGAVILLAAWFTVLRPKPQSFETTTTTTPATTPVSGPGKAVAAARKAASGAVATATPVARTKPSTTAADVKPETPAPAIPAEALAKLPEDVAHALRDRDVLVLGVIADKAKAWRPLADDDRYVRNALRRVNRYDGEVFVKTVPLAKLSTYAPVVGNLQVNQTPTVVVVDRDLKGRTLPGFVDRVSINQAIADARGPVALESAFLRDANRTCADFHMLIRRWSGPTVPGKKAEGAALGRLVGLGRQYRGRVARLAAPAKWRGLKAQWLRDVDMRRHMVGKLVAGYKRGDAAAMQSAVAEFDATSARRLDHRFDAAGLTRCSIPRRS